MEQSPRIGMGFPGGASGKEPAQETIYWVLQASLVAQLVKNPPAMQKTPFNSWVGKIHWRREQLPSPVFWPGESHGLYSPWGHKESDTLHFQPRVTVSLRHTQREDQVNKDTGSLQAKKGLQRHSPADTLFLNF